MTAEERPERLAVPEGTVRSRLFYALKALKLKIGIQKLRSEIVLKTVKTKTKKTYPPGSFFIQAEQPTKDGAASMANQFVKQATSNILRAFADGPAAARYPAVDNLDAMDEYAGDPIAAQHNLW